MKSYNNNSNNIKLSASSGDTSKPDNYQINAKICRLVERYPCMYDRSHPHYLKKDVVDKAWIKIAKEMDDSIPSCKERWRNIRTSFARSINVNKVPACANRTKPYYLHEELLFLTRHITPGIPISRRINAYGSAGEESEVIKVSVGEESFDGFAAMIRDDEEYDSQDQLSSLDECKEATKDGSFLQQPETPPTLQEEEPEAEAVYIVPPKKRQRLVDMLEASSATITAVTTTTNNSTGNNSSTGNSNSNNVGYNGNIVCNGLPNGLEMPSETEKERDIKPTDLPAPDSDFDSIFLQGLLPEIKAMSFQQKIKFKRRIYEVIGEIFESTQPSSNAGSTANAVRTVSTTSVSPTTLASVSTPTMTLVNAADLAMIRRLSSLLQSPTLAAASANSSAASTAISTNMSTSPTITARSTHATTVATPPTVTVHRGALTRSTSNLLRVTMVNAPVPSSTAQTQLVKQEPNLADD